MQEAEATEKATQQVAQNQKEAVGMLEKAIPKAHKEATAKATEEAKAVAVTQAMIEVVQIQILKPKHN